MEQPDLTPPSAGDTELETWYRANLSGAPIPDNGFSQRVITALPRRARRTVRRGPVCAAGLALGLAVALIGTRTSGNFPTTLSTLDSALTMAMEQLLTAPTGIALGITLFSLWFASRDQWRFLSRVNVGFGPKPRW